jgi:hypothetical protein
MEKLINVGEASKLLGVHPKTLRRDIINKGLLPVISIGKGGRGDRIRPSDLEAFIGERLCYIKGEQRGGQSLSTKGKELDKALGNPTKRQQKKKPVKLNRKLKLN